VQVVEEEHTTLLIGLEVEAAEAEVQLSSSIILLLHGEVRPLLEGLVGLHTVLLTQVLLVQPEIQSR